MRKMCFVTFLTFLKYYATNLVYDLRIKKKKKKHKCAERVKKPFRIT